MIVQDLLNISGRGLVLVVDLEDGDLFPRIGDKYYYKMNIYKVVGIELQRGLTSPSVIKRGVGLNVRNVTEGDKE